MKDSSKAVWPMTGAMQFTRIFMGANSTAMDLLSRLTAPFEPLYQVSPGRGRMPAVEPMFRITPPPCSRISGTTACVM